MRKGLIICLLICFALCGCVQNNTITSVTPTNPTNQPLSTITVQNTVAPKSGGELRIPMTYWPATTHPLFLKDQEMVNLYSMIFEPLIKLNDRREPTACIASNWEYNAANGNFTIHIRSGVRWHNGRELTASDVLFTYNTVINNEDSMYHATVCQYIQSVQTIDTYTLEFTPTTPSYAVYYALTVPIIPAYIYDNITKYTTIVPIGSGPYAVSECEIQKGSRMVLLRNTTWWKKQPYIAKIIAIGYEDNASAIQAVIDSQLDCAPTSKFTTDIYSTYDGISTYSYLTNYYDFLYPNMSNRLLSNVRIRQAISYAINRTAVLANIYTGHGIATETPFAVDTFLNDGSAEKYDYSLSEAVSILNRIGCQTDEDGIRVLNGSRLSFKLITVKNDFNPVRKDSAAVIQRQLEEAGIKITIEAYTEDEFNDAIANKQYDLALTGYYLSDLPLAEFALQKNGAGNPSGYFDPDCTALLNKALNCTVKADFIDAFNELNRYVSVQLPQIGLYTFYHTLLYNDKLHPSEVYRDMRVYENIEKWYITE